MEIPLPLDSLSFLRSFPLLALKTGREVLERRRLSFCFPFWAELRYISGAYAGREVSVVFYFFALIGLFFV